MLEYFVVYLLCVYIFVRLVMSSYLLFCGIYFDAWTLFLKNSVRYRGILRRDMISPYVRVSVSYVWYRAHENILNIDISTYLEKIRTISLPRISRFDTEHESFLNHQRFLHKAILNQSS